MNFVTLLNEKLLQKWLRFKWCKITVLKALPNKNWLRCPYLSTNPTPRHKSNYQEVTI